MRKGDFSFSRPCAVCANAILFFKSLAQRAQTCFCFSRALRSVRKRVLISFCLCATCASLFYFGNILAQRAQASFILETSLRGVRKPFPHQVFIYRRIGKLWRQRGRSRPPWRKRRPPCLMPEFRRGMLGALWVAGVCCRCGVVVIRGGAGDGHGAFTCFIRRPRKIQCVA